MRLTGLARFAVLCAVVFTCGCESHNKGKIEGTRWTSLSATVKGHSLPADSLQLSFGGDGRMVYKIKAGNLPEKSFTGSYSLGFGDSVTLHLDQELAGSKTHVETVKIEGNRLIMTDSDGTTMTFTKK